MSGPLSGSLNYCGNGEELHWTLKFARRFAAPVKTPFKRRALNLEELSRIALRPSTVDIPKTDVQVFRQEKTPNFSEDDGGHMLKNVRRRALRSA